MRRTFLTTALWAALLALMPLAATAQEAAADADAGAPEVVEMALGDPGAPVTVIEYASFTCPHCASFHETSFDRLKTDYIDTGKVRFVYREVYFDRFGLWAGMVARCGSPESYFGFVDALYDGQKEWIGDGAPAAIADNLRRMGRMAGLSDGEVNACLEDQVMAEALVAEYQKNAAADGIESTPSFVIDGQTYKNMPWDEFTGLIDAALPEG